MPSTKDYADFILEQLFGLPKASMAIPYEGTELWAWIAGFVILSIIRLKYVE